jgi:hypothetical protein
MHSFAEQAALVWAQAHTDLEAKDFAKRVAEIAEVIARGGKAASEVPQLGLHAE